MRRGRGYGGDPTIKSTYKRAKKQVFESIFARAVRPKLEKIKIIKSVKYK